MPKGRPGGNPEFGTKYVLTTDRPEALTEKITVRIPPTMKKKLKQLSDYPEFIREAIEEKLEKM
jgi:glycyl-tRNA synthetase (class II)